MIEFFTDPVLRAPTIGSLLIGLSCALIGAIAFLRKQSLIGEALSHTTYPGIIFGVMFASTWEGSLFFATIAALLGYYMINWLEKQWKISSDAALCTVLSLFFGVGVTLSSYVQFAKPELYRQSFIYLYGQAATMTDQHVLIYAILTCIIIASITAFYKELHLITFDRQSAHVLGLPVAFIDALFFSLVVLSVVVGIRTVGIVLISAMLISPPVAARQWTNSFFKMLLLSGFFGMVSGYFGNYFSITLSDAHSLPTGPMIVLTAAFITLFSLLFAPAHGLIPKLYRHMQFRLRCVSENVIKGLWRKDPKAVYSFNQIKEIHSIFPLFLHFILSKLIGKGLLTKEKEGYLLTDNGIKQGAHIVRLHRLWELYLANYLGANEKRVHKSAEMMEHIITPELEKELTELLHDPKEDPHKQPIPPMES